MEDKVLELIKMVQNISPDIWRIANQQVVVDDLVVRIQLYIMGVLFVALLALVIYMGYRIESPERGSDTEYEGWTIVIGVILLACLVVLLFCAIGAHLRYTLNPEFAAIQKLIGLLK